MVFFGGDLVVDIFGGNLFVLIEFFFYNIIFDFVPTTMIIKKKKSFISLDEILMEIKWFWKIKCCNRGICEEGWLETDD